MSIVVDTLTSCGYNKYMDKTNNKLFAVIAGTGTAAWTPTSLDNSAWAARVAGVHGWVGTNSADSSDAYAWLVSRKGLPLAKGSAPNGGAARMAAEGAMQSAVANG